MNKFKEALEFCDLHDLGFTGDPFTWRNNSHEAVSYIRERLDRVVASELWCTHFPGFKVINDNPRHSDHRPVVLVLDDDKRTRSYGEKQFRFEAKWLEEENCNAVVENAWLRETRGRGGDAVTALKGVASDLKDWSNNTLGDLEKRIARVKKDLEKWRRMEISKQQVNREHVLRYKLEKMEHQRDMYWRQRAHVKWLEKGDRNTSFFHSHASARKKRNKIKKLVRDDGVVVEGESEMAAVVTNYFDSLFTSSTGHRLEELLEHVSLWITPHMNQHLLKDFTAEEVKEAMFSIGDLKAPGPDGMSAVFYKRHWHLVGDQITAEVLAILKGGGLPPEWNDTTVVLIPKVTSPEKMKDLRPISLCNVLYKVVSKMLANRLKLLLPDIIAPNQSAFVPGRLITDTILLAYEAEQEDWLTGVRCSEARYEQGV
jgi:hypothetical protein